VILVVIESACIMGHSGIRLNSANCLPVVFRCLVRLDLLPFLFVYYEFDRVAFSPFSVVARIFLKTASQYVLFVV